MLGNKDENPTDIPETEPEPGGTPVEIQFKPLTRFLMTELLPIFNILF